MTLTRTLGSLHQQKVSKSATALFNNLGIYRFCIAVTVLDFLDILNVLDRHTNNYEKYIYSAVILGLMFAYFLRWKRVDISFAPIIFLFFFIFTGWAFVIKFLTLDLREGYVAAETMVFAIALFIPPNSIVLDAHKIVKLLTYLFSVGTVFYLVETIVKPLDVLSSVVGLHEVMFTKSIICVLALCLCILTGRQILALFVAVITAIALALRPTSTLVLALTCCLPIAFALKLRVSGFRPTAVLLSRTIAMGTLFLAAAIPLLLYFFFDDIASMIYVAETYIKADLLGGHSNTDFRLAILRLSFDAIDRTSFWYGSALTGGVTVPLGMLPEWQGWWATGNVNGQAPIHSDFVIVFVLMGILGYILFALAFYLVLKNRFRELARRDTRGSGVVLQAIAIIAVVALLIYCSDEPYLAYYNHSNVVWLLLLISEVAMKSTIIDRSERRYQTALSRESLLNRPRG